MDVYNRPLVIMTHQLPNDWILPLSERCNLIAGPEDATELDSNLKQFLPEAEGLLSLLTIPVQKELLDLAPKLKVISNLAVGVDNIDIQACTYRKIPVGNTPGVLTESTADLTMALILSIARNIPNASKDARNGMWKTWLPSGWLGMELNGSTLGIIGMGKIGQAVARRAQGFGLRVLFHDSESKVIPNAHQATLEELLQESDIVSLHTPLTPETREMINETSLSRMKPTAILINAARGPLVNTNALVEALESNIIKAAALDVTDPEPLPMNHPLFRLNNCLIVPHIGSATQNTRRNMARLASENILAGLRGERLPNCVNPEVYE